VEAAPTGNEPGSNVMESLMAGLLLARPQQPPEVEHALPGGDLLGAVAPSLTSASTVQALAAAAMGTEAQPLASADAGDLGGAPTGIAVPVPGQTDGGPLAGSADARPAIAPASQPQPGTAGDGGDEASERDARESMTQASGAGSMPEPQTPVLASVATPAAGEPATTSMAAGAMSQPPVVTAEPPTVVRTVAAANAPVEVAEIVRGAAIDGDDRVVLRLDPPELGTLEVHIERQNGAIRVRVEASQAGARELIEQALPALQQALEARDLRVERLEVRTLADAASGRSATEQGGQSGRDRQSRQDEMPEWSPVAAIDGALIDGPSKGDGDTSARLDVMA
jgi:flagellar hook-length control protein FliK